VEFPHHLHWHGIGGLCNAFRFAQHFGPIAEKLLQSGLHVEVGISIGREWKEWKDHLEKHIIPHFPMIVILSHIVLSHIDPLRTCEKNGPFLNDSKSSS
jgi:hypothetical protein